MKTTKDLDEKLAIFDQKLDALNAAQTDATVAAAALVSWAELGLKVVEIAGPIVSQQLAKKKADPDPVIEKEGEEGMKEMDAINNALAMISKIKV